VRPVIFTGGLLSVLSFSREGFCPPCHFHGRAFVRPVIFKGGLLSALSFLDGGGLLSYTPFVILSFYQVSLDLAYNITIGNLTPSLFSLLYIFGQQFLIIPLYFNGQQFPIHSISSANSSAV
jgi:hypothetical protein